MTPRTTRETRRIRHVGCCFTFVTGVRDLTWQNFVLRIPSCGNLLDETPQHSPELPTHLFAVVDRSVVVLQLQSARSSETCVSDAQVHTIDVTTVISETVHHAGKQTTHMFNNKGNTYFCSSSFSSSPFTSRSSCILFKYLKRRKGLKFMSEQLIGIKGRFP